MNTSEETINSRCLVGDYSSPWRRRSPGVFHNIITRNVHPQLLTIISSPEMSRWPKNVAVYTIFQATKDGKKVMPYDYVWGSGSLYFRSDNAVPIWYVDNNGNTNDPRPISSLSAREKEAMLHTRKKVPDDWLICNGFLLPENYVDVDLFESIYQTHNCYRVFLANSKKKDDAVVSKMSKVRGLMIEDLEARKICAAACYSLFHKHDARWLDTNQRLLLAKELRGQYYLSFRQLATLCRLPETEIRKYVR